MTAKSVTESEAEVPKGDNEKGGEEDEGREGDGRKEGQRERRERERAGEKGKENNECGRTAPPETGRESSQMRLN